MTKWSTICANFTEEEVMMIDEICKKLNCTRSQAVRASVAMGIHIVLLNAVIGEKSAPLVQMILPVMKKLFPNETIKEIEKDIDTFQKRHPKIVKKATEDANLLNESVKVFVKHEKRGAPKKAKRKRGKPSRKETSM